MPSPLSQLELLFLLQLCPRTSPNPDHFFNSNYFTSSLTGAPTLFTSLIVSPLPQVLLKHYRRIYQIYQYYSSLSPTFTFSITERMYFQFTQDARIPDDSFTITMVEKLFILGTHAVKDSCCCITIIITIITMSDGSVCDLLSVGHFT